LLRHLRQAVGKFRSARLNHVVSPRLLIANAGVFALPRGKDRRHVSSAPVQVFSMLEGERPGHREDYLFVGGFTRRVNLSG
jgi:hypothetical protein